MSAQTETIEITGLPEGTREAIRELSQSKGKSADEYLRTLIEAELLSQQSFAENPRADSRRFSEKRND